MDIMVKGSGSIREGRAEDGKLCSHLEWPNITYSRVNQCNFDVVRQLKARGRFFVAVCTFLCVCVCKCLCVHLCC